MDNKQLLTVVLICLTVIAAAYLYTEAMRYESDAMVKVVKEGCE